jgi:hypothetical protein
LPCLSEAPPINAFLESLRQKSFGYLAIEEETAYRLRGRSKRARNAPTFANIARFGGFDDRSVESSSSEIQYQGYVFALLGYQGMPDAVPVILKHGKRLWKEIDLADYALQNSPYRVTIIT